MHVVELSHNGQVQAAAAGSNSRTLMRSELPSESMVEAAVSSRGEASLVMAPSQHTMSVQEPVDVGVGQTVNAGVEHTEQTLEKVAAHQHDAASPESMAETDEEILPMLGVNNMADIAYKAMDMLYGTAGIIPEDYPFGCICNDAGMCDGDAMATSCKARAGSWSHARQGALAVPPALLLLPMAWLATLAAAPL